VSAAVFNAIACFVGEFAKVHFPCVAGDPQHEDVGTRAKNAVFQAGDDHAFDFGVFKTNSVQCVIKLNVHAQVVAVEFEFVARANAAVFVDVELQGGNLAFVFHRPMLVLAGLHLIVDRGGLGHDVSKLMPSNLRRWKQGISATFVQYSAIQNA